MPFPPTECDCENPKCQATAVICDVLKEANRYVETECEKQKKLVELATNLKPVVMDQTVLNARLNTVKQCVCQSPACWKVMREARMSYEEFMSVMEAKDKFESMYRFTVEYNQGLNKKHAEFSRGRVDTVAKFGEKLENKLMEFRRLEFAHSELVKDRKTPWHRDTEFLDMMKEVEKYKESSDYWNRVVHKANLAQEQWEAREKALKATIEEMKMDTIKMQEEMEKQNQIIHAYKICQPEELRENTFTGKCREYICGAKKAEMYDHWYKTEQERLRLSALSNDLIDENKKLKEERTHWKELHDKAVIGHYEQQLLDGMEIPPQVIMVDGTLNVQQIAADMIDAELQMKFDSIFRVDTISSVQQDENDLYDKFLADQEPGKRMDVLDMMYAACHGGKKMTDRDKKSYKPDDRKGKKTRMFKSCFSACLKRMRGVSRRKGTKILWTNIHLRRQPVFLEN